MTILAIVSVISLSLALLPCLLYFANVRLFRPPPMSLESDLPVSVSVLIPARNEEDSIEACVKSVLANRHVTLEVIVLDDHSTDRTAEIVKQIADPRVRLETAPPLPGGWSGKQHACFELSKLAKYDLLTFLDADVRLEPDALARMAAFQKVSQADLVSGFPRQETGTLFEKLLIPLIHWLLLGFLPFARMRIDRRPGLGAGCGQWFFTTREAYQKVGGHAVIKDSFHDGIKLPRAYRAAGLMTDLCDVTNLATCRMYSSASQVWFGLAKNAREGIGNPRLIVIFTLLFLMGQVLPWVWLSWSIILNQLSMIVLNCVTLFLTLLPRFDAANRFRQSWLGAVLHPFAIILLLMIQWFANLRVWLGQPVGWKGRTQPQ